MIDALGDALAKRVSNEHIVRKAIDAGAHGASSYRSLKIFAQGSCFVKRRQTSPPIDDQPWTPFDRFQQNPRVFCKTRFPLAPIQRLTSDAWRTLWSRR